MFFLATFTRITVITATTVQIRASANPSFTINAVEAGLLLADIQEGDDGGVHWTLRPLPQLVRCCLNLGNFLVRFSNVNLQSVFRLEGVSTLVRFSFHICEVSFPSTFLHQAATVKYMLIQFSAMLPHPKHISRSARTSWNTFVS